jgi:hypothetical protein
MVSQTPPALTEARTEVLLPSANLLLFIATLLVRLIIGQNRSDEGRSLNLIPGPRRTFGI